MTKVLGFDWDDGNLAKCRKHGVSVEEIEFILSNDPIVSPDMTHSLDEQRMIAVGRHCRGPANLCGLYGSGARRFDIRAVGVRPLHAQ